MSGAVLITGASTGIGQACARGLAAQGFRVFAGVRRAADAEVLDAIPGVEAVRVDVTDADQVAALAQRLDAELGEDGLHALVNNAGIGTGGPVERLALADYQRILDVNFLGLIRVTQAMLPLIRRGAPGRIVNISSVGGRWAGPFLSPYHASKWAVEGFSDSLRMELHGQGIPVVVVEPGAVATPIWGKAEGTLHEVTGELDAQTEARYGRMLRQYAKLVARQARDGIAPERVADKVLHALRSGRPRTRYLVGADAIAIAWLRWLLPDRAFDAFVRRALGL